MGVDKSYGSGKSRSSSNSSTRRNAANSANLRKQGGERTASARKAESIRNMLRTGPQLDPSMALGVSTRVLRGAAAALAAGGNVVRAQMATQRANLATSGRATAKSLAQAKAYEAKFGNPFPQLPSSSTSIKRSAVTTNRPSTEAYPRSFDSIVGRSPRSTPANQTTPSAQNFFQGGRRYVDTRYNYDPITSNRVVKYDPRTGYATQPKVITGPKPGAALNPTGARYAPPRRPRGSSGGR